MFIATDGPRYQKAWTTHIVIYAIQFSTLIFLRARLMRLNTLKRGAQGLPDSNLGGEDAEGEVSQDNGALCFLLAFLLFHFRG